MQTQTLIILFTTVILTYAGEFTAVTIDSWPPFMYRDSSGEIHGVATEIVKRLFNEAEVTYTLKVAPWARAYYMAKTKNNHCIFMLYHTEERDTLFQWVGPIIPPINSYFYRLKNRTDIKIENMDDAKKYKIGVVRGVAHHSYLNSIGFLDGDHLDPVATPKLNIAKLKMQRIDLIVSNKITLPYLLKEHNMTMDDVTPILDVVESEPAFIGFNSQSDSTSITHLQETFKELQRVGVIDSILNSY